MMLILLMRKDKLLFTSVAGECTYTCRHGLMVCARERTYCSWICFFLHVSVCECMNVCVWTGCMCACLCVLKWVDGCNVV